MKTSPLNQRYGDAWAHTVVEKLRDIPLTSRAGFELFVLAFLMGSTLVVFLDALGIVLQGM